MLNPPLGRWTFKMDLSIRKRLTRRSLSFSASIKSEHCSHSSSCIIFQSLLHRAIYNSKRKPLIIRNSFPCVTQTYTSHTVLVRFLTQNQTLNTPNTFGQYLIVMCLSNAQKQGKILWMVRRYWYDLYKMNNDINVVDYVTQTNQHTQCSSWFYLLGCMGT